MVWAMEEDVQDDAIVSGVPGVTVCIPILFMPMDLDVAGIEHPTDPDACTAHIRPGIKRKPAGMNHIHRLAICRQKSVCVYVLFFPDELEEPFMKMRLRHGAPFAE